MSPSTPPNDARWQQLPLADMSVLGVHGAEAVRFLQGQLSNNVERLSGTRSLLAGFHNPQGRAIALLRLVRGAQGEVLALLPRELAAAVAGRLSKFILRARVRIADDTAAWQLSGLIAPAGADIPQGLPQDVDGQSTLEDGSLAVRVPGTPWRWLLLGAAGHALPAVLPQAVTGERERWRRLDIEAGLPQVYTGTSEGFVAQMLNLDLLDAVAFDKGCYTGQEVIARAHYRGRVKRRMQRFLTRTDLALAPGDSARLADGRTLTVIDCTVRADGARELLGVTALAAGEGEDAAQDAASQPGLALAAEALPLPYPLPA
jgi:folate-binding protein YgfZ